jgi:hypothetical protein
LVLGICEGYFGRQLLIGRKTVFVSGRIGEKKRTAANMKDRVGKREALNFAFIVTTRSRRWSRRDGFPQKAIPIAQELARLGRHLKT